MIVIATAKAPHNRRVDFATNTWTRADKVVEIECARSDSRGCYYAKDVYDAALRLAPGDIFCYLNNDVALVPEWPDIIVPEVRRNSCACSGRVEVERFETPLHLYDLNHADAFEGRDFFAFTPGWWRQVRGTIPDLLLGYDSYDFVICETMHQCGAMPLPPVCYHEIHPAFWRLPENIDNHPGQVYNRELRLQWLANKPRNLSTSAGNHQTNLSTSAELFQ